MLAKDEDISPVSSRGILLLQEYEEKTASPETCLNCKR